MKKNNKLLSIYEVVIFLFILFYRFIVINKFISYANYINIAFWLLISISLIIIRGFPKDKHYFKKTSLKIVVIVLLIYFIVTGILGLFTGFFRTVYSHTFISIIKNVTPIVIYIIVIEVARYLLIRRGPNKLHTAILCILFIMHNINIAVTSIDFSSQESMFLILSLIIMPIISRELLFVYMTKNISLAPSLLYHILMDTYTMVIPVLPDLGNYISSVCLVFIPYVIYIQIKRGLKLKEDYAGYAKKTILKVSSAVLLIFFIILIILVSGVFKYKMVAIASDSMNPVYYRGDAVVYQKIKPDDVQEGEILAFQVNNQLVTHRVVKIIYKDNKRQFITKGDNNEEIDRFEVGDKNVVGVVKYVVKYIAFPTIWFSESTEEVN